MPIHRIPRAFIEPNVLRIERELDERIVSVLPDGDDLLVVTEMRALNVTRPGDTERRFSRIDGTIVDAAGVPL